VLEAISLMDWERILTIALWALIGIVGGVALAIWTVVALKWFDVL
jgi:hypothetical protein